MADAFQLWAIGLAALLDTALLFVVFERRNRPFALAPIVVLLVASWLFHAGLFFWMLLGPSPGPWRDEIAAVCLLAVTAGLLIKPSGMLHAAVRMHQTGLDLMQRPTFAYGLLYLPAVALGLTLTLRPSDLPAATVPIYLSWLVIANLVAAALFFRTRRLPLPGASAYFATVAGLLIVQAALGLFVFGYARAAWPDLEPWLIFACGIPGVVLELFFAYTLVRFHFLRLSIERAVVYGAILAGLAAVHQIAFHEATRSLPLEYRFAIVLLEGAVVAALVMLYAPLRQRVAESLRYLMGARVAGVRERLRQLSVHLSGRSTRPTNEILAWFADELPRALDVEFVAGWISSPGRDLQTRFGATERLDLARVNDLAAAMRSTNRLIIYPYDAGPHCEALLAAGAAVVLLKTHPNVHGLIVLGTHPRNRPLADEEVGAVLLLVEQLTTTLENSVLFADRLAAERRAAQLEKLSALGLMASAIAHEVKNPLSAIKTIAAVLAEDLGKDSPHAESVAMILGEIDRLSATTRQLLDIARPPGANDGPIQLERVLSSTAEILRRLAHERDIALETRLADDLPAVYASEQSLREIFFNLVSNSLDAAPAGGRVTLICMRMNGHVVTEVRDTGPGIAAEIRERLYQPFVTGKPGGTGLGLYVVGRRVRELGGEIACESGPQGTSFIVKIPANPRESDQCPNPKSQRSPNNQ